MPAVLTHAGYCNILATRIQEKVNSELRLKEREEQEALPMAFLVSQHCPQVRCRSQHPVLSTLNYYIVDTHKELPLVHFQ